MQTKPADHDDRSTLDAGGSRRGPPLALCFVFVAALGFGFGFGTNQIPAPEHFGPMWLADFAAPYALLPFLAGAWAVPHQAGAIAAGLIVEFAAFFGYYTELIVDTGGGWVNLLTLHNSWLGFEIFAGVVFGYLGHLWWRRGSVVAGLTCAAIPILEPLVRLARVDAWWFRRLPALNFYPSEYPRSTWNLTLWAAELLVGVALAWLVLRHRPWRTTNQAVHPRADAGW
ncbi:MAG: hypothetical protein ACR2LE_09310 [Nocardioidaceae bacterium]